MYFVLYFGVVIVYIRQHKPLRKGLEALLACENASGPDYWRFILAYM